MTESAFRTSKSTGRTSTLRIGHSPDPDDAFMWFPLTGIDGDPPLLDTGRFRFEAVQQDIESLNRRSETGDLEITAISIAQLPFVVDRYALTSCGSSMGDGYGPKIVSRAPIDDPVTFLRDPTTRIAVPGRRTSAWLTTALLLERAEFNYESVPFEEIIDRVRDGEFDAGVVIHEGQLTYSQSGLHLLVDLGEWWTAKTSLPLPLGANVIRLDLEQRFGSGSLTDIAGLLVQSIQYALAHREEAIDYALRFGRGLDRDLADRFVAMYVNKHTLDYGQRGRHAVQSFLAAAEARGLTPACSESLRFISPTSRQVES